MDDRLPHLHLSRRESQAMDALYRLGEGTVSDVLGLMPDEPSYNTVRNTLAILERKGYVEHRKAGKRYVYAPVEGVQRAQHSMIRHLVRTFFDGSVPRAVSALLGSSRERLTREELDEIARYVEEARKEIG